MKARIEHYSIILFRPLDATAREWLHETAPEEAQFFGGALVVEPRYQDGVTAAFLDAGGEIV